MLIAQSTIHLWLYVLQNISDFLDHILKLRTLISDTYNFILKYNVHIHIFSIFFSANITRKYRVAFLYFILHRQPKPCMFACLFTSYMRPLASVGNGISRLSCNWFQFVGSFHDTNLLISWRDPYKCRAWRGWGIKRTLGALQANLIQ